MQYGMKETDEQYHGQNEMRGGHCLSSHGLIKFMKSPRAYRMECDGQGKSVDTDAFAFGRAAHTFILEGSDAFANAYAVGGPINPKTGECYGSTTKAFAEWRAAQGKLCITQQEYDAIVMMDEMVCSHGLASSYLGSGEAEAVYRGTMFGKECQIKVDWIDEEANNFVDLKTCRDLDRFKYDFRDYQYDIQLAFYHLMLMQRTGRSYQPVVIVVEKAAPYRVAVFEPTPDTMGDAITKVMSAILELNHYERFNDWPTGFEDAISI